MPDSLMRATTIEGRTPGPHLLVTGGVHGDEFAPMRAARELLDRVDAGDLSGTLTVIPMVNRGAFLRGHRAADDDKDLARTCPGDDDGSITERVAAELSRMIESVDYYIDLHTGSADMSVFPLAGYTLHPDASVLDAQRLMARAFNLPVVWGTSPTLQGRTLSVARDANVPAIYTEYLGSGVCDSKGVAAYVAGCLNVMAALKMLDRPSPESHVRYVVEDPRPNSGHMQIQNLATMTGFFDPAVKLGDAIEAGQPIGSIWNQDDDSVTEVLSHQTGIVLVLRTFSRVLEGDSLGVVLEK